jgi:hypothetical protein
MKMSRSSASVTMLSALLVLLACPCAQAQKVFRCGSNYQDRPCESGASSKAVKGISQDTVPATAVNQISDASCTKRGTDAQQIMWAREAGKTADVQTAQATSDDQRRLIADVFNRRGSAVDVRNAVQAACLEEKAQAAHAAALAAALKAQGLAPAAGPNSGVPPTTDPMATQQTTATDNKSQCARLSAQLEDIRNRQRTGGSSKTMDSLTQQRQSAEKAARDAGC